MGSALINGVTASCVFFCDRGTFWVLLLTSFYLHESARVYFCPPIMSDNLSREIGRTQVLLCELLEPSEMARLCLAHRDFSSCAWRRDVTRWVLQLQDRVRARVCAGAFQLRYLERAANARLAAIARARVRTRRRARMWPRTRRLARLQARACPQSNTSRRLINKTEALPNYKQLIATNDTKDVKAPDDAGPRRMAPRQRRAGRPWSRRGVAAGEVVPRQLSRSLAGLFSEDSAGGCGIHTHAHAQTSW